MTEARPVRVLLFAPGGRESDDALVRTRWMAERTRETIDDCVSLFDQQATRTRLAGALTDERAEDIAGVVFFSHGRRAHIGRCTASDRAVVQDDAIMGADGPAMDAENLHVLNGRWGHAIACHAGTELAAQAYAHGATCFVGYRGALIVEWNPDALPDDIRPRFIELITCTTRNLMAGVRDEKTLRARVNRIADDIADWCTKQDEPVAGIEITAQQLVGLLVYRGPDRA